MKISWATLVIVVLATAWGVIADERGPGEFPLYVGKAVCLECHRDVRGSPCALGAIPEHDGAFRLLSTDNARSIAALSGISERPTDNLVCLYCHATAADEGPRWTAETFSIADGVQCEACHGGGSLHVQAVRSVGSDPRLFIRRSDRDDCDHCHTDRPSHRAVLEDGFALSPADSRYKTPVDLAVSPDGKRLFVVCEAGDSLIVVETISGNVAREIPVGKRPHGVALSPNGETVYVSNRMSGSLSVIAASTLEVVAEIEVGHEPHGIALDPTGEKILVLDTGENSASLIDAESRTVTRRLVMGVGPWSIALGPDGRRAYVTSVRPSPKRFRDPPQSEVSVIDVEHGIVETRLMVPGANMLQGIAPVPGADVALFTMMRTKNLIPTSRLAQGWVITNGLGVVWPDGRVDQVLLDDPADSLPDLMDVAVSPDGRRAVVVSGGADRVAVIDVAKMLDVIESATDVERVKVLPDHMGKSSHFVLARVPVGRNPRAVAYSPDGRLAYVVNALDDSVAVVDTTANRVVRTILLGGPQEITKIRRGERLFHDASNTFGRQFSCRSCHPDGHHNGLTFDIEADEVGLNPVDNRTLRGILDTPPFKWEGTNPSLHRQCGARLAVFFTRQDPYTPDELDSLVKYMCTIEQPPNRFRDPDGLTPAQRRGKGIFERTTRNDGSPIPPTGQCGFCHSGAYLTNRNRYDVATTMWFDQHVVVDLENLSDKAHGYGRLGAYYFVDVGGDLKILDVPHLRNIADGAPYLHNGAAHTLEEIWTVFNMSDQHGFTADLTRQQMNDLIEYLKSQ
jgi:YVTN family beta-propeller protein